MVEQLDDSPQGARDVRVLDQLALVVSHRLDELREPDADIDGERLPLERLNGHRPTGGREDGPQLVYSHSVLLSRSTPLAS